MNVELLFKIVQSEVLSLIRHILLGLDIQKYQHNIQIVTTSFTQQMIWMQILRIQYLVKSVYSTKGPSLCVRTVYRRSQHRIDRVYIHILNTDTRSR
jgi:hypothetical protein